MKRERTEIPKDAQEKTSGDIPENMETGQQNSSDSPEEKKISLFPLFVVNFIGTLGFSIVLPFLVFLVNRLGGNAFVYGPLQPLNIHTGSCAFVGFKKVLGCSPYNLWKPDAGYKFLLLIFRRFLPDLSCNSISRPWRRAYDAFFSSLLSKIAGRRYQGTVQGFASSLGSLASIFGLILGGLL